MRQLDVLIVWSGIILFGIATLVVSFYVLSFLIPILLAVGIAGFLLNWGRGLWYARRANRFGAGVYPHENHTQSSKDIIDVEYQIIDDDRK